MWPGEIHKYPLRRVPRQETTILGATASSCTAPAVNRGTRRKALAQSSRCWQRLNEAGGVEGDPHPASTRPRACSTRPRLLEPFPYLATFDGARSIFIGALQTVQYVTSPCQG